MGGMGRSFDGGYAEYTCVPERSVFRLHSDLPWQTLGAIPEMFQTAWGSLHEGLDAQRGQTLLVRGGTSSIGIATTQLAKRAGLTVIATTRNPARADSLIAGGADHVVIDSGTIEALVRELFPDGVDRVLELVGTVTLFDSLRCTRSNGIVCMTGMLGNEWSMRDFDPFATIPPTVRLTVYTGEAENMDIGALQRFIDDVAAGEATVNVDRVFRLEEVGDAHQFMEESRATGKLVVVVDH